MMEIRRRDLFNIIISRVRITFERNTLVDKQIDYTLYKLEYSKENSTETLANVNW